MSTPSRRRLMRDLKRLETDCPDGVTAAPTSDNIMVWNAVIFGPEDTPFEDGTFHLILTFDETYPNKPPKCLFTTPIFHPNVYADGSICLDILQNRWSPTYDVTALLTSIQSLLPDPNPTSAANGEAARLFNSSKAAYEARVRQCVEASWMHRVPGLVNANSSDEDLDDASTLSETLEDVQQDRKRPRSEAPSVPEREE